MKTIIAGSRFLSGAIIQSIIKDSGLHITEVISGGCRGVDIEGEKYAKENNLPVTIFPANWDKHGRAAGPMRNQQMAEYGDILLLIWDGKSKGSASMKREMEKLGKPVFEVIK